MVKIPIFEPYFKGNEELYLNRCIKSTWISSQGEYIKEFEKMLADFHNVKYAIATSNCTTALHLSLKALNIGKGDEVICPDLTFIAPANMITLSGAQLKLVDVDKTTLTLDPKIVENSITGNTKAIMIVHQFGQSAHMDELLYISKKYNLKVIEDNAESIGAKYKGKLLGALGDVSVNSFFGNKIITTGEGGCLLTNDFDTALRCQELRDHGMSHKKKYHHIDLGYNYRMTNMQAAVGVAQMEQLENILDIRRKQMLYYYDALSNVSGINLRKFTSWCSPVHWLITLTLDPEYNRDGCLKYMQESGVDCRQMINPVHQAQHYFNFYNDEEFLISNQVSHQSLHLPSSTGLEEHRIDYIVDTLKKFLSQKQHNY